MKMDKYLKRGLINSLENARHRVESTSKLEAYDMSTIIESLEVLVHELVVEDQCGNSADDKVLEALDELQQNVRKKVERVRSGPISRREEGYEEAMLRVMSMIHNMKERYKKNGKHD